MKASLPRHVQRYLKSLGGCAGLSHSREVRGPSRPVQEHHDGASVLDSGDGGAAYDGGRGDRLREAALEGHVRGEIGRS